MNELIRIVQLPAIVDQLPTLRERWQQWAEDAKAMACTEETLGAVKGMRAQMRKEYAEIDGMFKQVISVAMEPIEKVRASFRDCVTSSYNEADSAFKNKANEVESEIKRRCEESLLEYFDELCAAHRVDWLKYEQAGIKVDMASAKQKTPKKLREQLVCFVVRVASDVDTISTMEHAEEILAEYKPCLSLSQAISTVIERHRRIEEERVALDTRSTEKAAENAAISRIEALTPPTIVNTPEIDENEVIPRCTFTAINATRAKLKLLKEFMEEQEIEYI